MASTFRIECPNCKMVNDFSDDNWNDELIDTSDYTYTNCMYCDHEMTIETLATYKLKIVDNE
jgi:hypothetical protein